MVNMTRQMKEDSENPGKHRDDDCIIDNDSDKNVLEDYGYFNGFHENDDFTSKADWRTVRIFMGFLIMRMLPARLTRPI